LQGRQHSLDLHHLAHEHAIIESPSVQPPPPRRQGVQCGLNARGKQKEA